MLRTKRRVPFANRVLRFVICVWKKVVRIFKRKIQKEKNFMIGIIDDLQINGLFICFALNLIDVKTCFWPYILRVSSFSL